MSPRARGARLALLVIVPGGWLAAASCTGDEDAGGAGGAGGTTASTTTTTSSTSSTTSTGGGSACPPLAFPPEVPAGWSELTDWSCDCRFYYPPTPELMPAPIAWEPCPAALGSVDCRKMVVDWTPAHAFAIYSQAPLYVHDDGTPTLMFRRISERWITDMIADADGPVRMAVMRVRGSQETAGGSGAGCSLGSPGYRWPRFALGVQGHDSEGDWLTSPHQGALAGTVDSPKPEVFRHYTDGRVRSWFMSADYIAWGNSTDFKVVASPWDETEIDVTSPPDDPDHLHANQVRWWKDALFWKTNGGS
ncbi:MAG: hypothetical protein HY908_24950, partial [Myxococcales bacterium]|nr:hypothetical protein [Myxococcales bacterium]